MDDPGNPAAARSARRQPLDFRTITVVGGGCYGSYYVRQLRRARDAGAASWTRLVVVDRDPDCAVAHDQRSAAEGDSPVSHPELAVADWGNYFDRELTLAAESGDDCAGDAIVPSPLMPHLLFEWLERRATKLFPGATIRGVPVDGAFQLPWERLGADGTRYVSYADWTCPVNCIEPSTCPHTRGERDWSLPVTLRRKGADFGSPGSAPPEIVTFHCTHRVYGVGMIDVRDVLAAERLLRSAPERGSLELLVGTTSHCHGAVSRLAIDGPVTAGTGRG